MLNHIFFDFFGTLVAYSPSRRDQGYSISHKILKDAGATHSYDEFLDLWCIVSEEFDTSAEKTHREFSMMEVGEAFLQRMFEQQPQAELTSRFVNAYLAEWNKGVRYLPDLSKFVERMSKRYRLGVITNTSDSEIVLNHLEQTGVRGLFDVVVTSVEFGLRKPHPDIFHFAMREVGAGPQSSAYVGDSFEADYRGALAAGMRPFLIDPQNSSPVAEEARLANLFDLEQRLVLAR